MNFFDDDFGLGLGSTPVYTKKPSYTYGQYSLIYVEKGTLMRISSLANLQKKMSSMIFWMTWWGNKKRRVWRRKKGNQCSRIVVLILTLLLTAWTLKRLKNGALPISKSISLCNLPSFHSASIHRSWMTALARTHAAIKVDLRGVKITLSLTISSLSEDRPKKTHQLLRDRREIWWSLHSEKNSQKKTWRNRNKRLFGMISLKLASREECHPQNSPNRPTSIYCQAKRCGERAEAIFLLAIYKQRITICILMRK